MSIDDPKALQRAEDLFVTRSVAAEPGDRAASLTFADMVNFLTDPEARLTHEQERLLFSNARVRRDFTNLKQSLRWRPELASGPSIAPAAAAAGGDRLSERTFPGGRLRIIPSSVGQQVFISIHLDDTKDPPSLLAMELPDAEVAKVALPPPESDGTILLIKDLADADDARLVRLLRDPMSSGHLR